MNPLLNCPTRTLETPAITTLAGNGFAKNISQENQLNNFGVASSTSEETILCSTGASTNILFSDRKNKNNCKLKRRLIKFATSVFIFFALPSLACANDNVPTSDDGKLPDYLFPFPLRDVRWVEVHIGGGAFGVPSYIDTITYSVHQTGENTSDIYVTKKKTTGEYQYIDGKSVFIPDSTWTIAPALFIRILLEDKKLYWVNGEKLFLMYDFNLKIGDRFVTDGLMYHWDYPLASIDSVFLGNEYLNRYNFKGSSSRYDFSVIEVIGNDNHFYYMLDNPYIYIDPFVSITFKVYHNEQMIFEQNKPYLMGE